MNRVWLYSPEVWWHGWRTLRPVHMSEDEYNRRTLVIGWNFTGQVVIALWECRNPDCPRTGLVPADASVEESEYGITYISLSYRGEREFDHSECLHATVDYDKDGRVIGIEIFGRPE